MERHFEFTIEKFEELFSNCKLDTDYFSHEAHLRLAWIYISQYGLKNAEKRIQQQLKNYVASIGAEDKYNETLTIAATKAVWHFMQRSRSDNFKDFILEFPKLKTHFKSLIGSHYSIDVYNSTEAKTNFIAPDLSDF